MGDPFRAARDESGVLQCPFHGEDITMILRHEDVRRAAKDWKTFSSDAPFRVPIPSEEGVRTMRQLPIETNPPEHTDYRKITDPFFQRPKDPAFIARIEALIDGLLVDALGHDAIEIVNEFALPLQSRALTYLLNVPERTSAAPIWAAITVRHGCQISLATKRSPPRTAGPSAAKPLRKVAWVRRGPTHSRRRQCPSIWWITVKNRSAPWPLPQWISSMPMAVTPASERWANP